MKHNVGTVDRVIRVVIGIALLSLFVLLEGPMKWLGLLALIPFFTAAIGWCPLYAMFGISTCPTRTKETAHR